MTALATKPPPKPEPPQQEQHQSQGQYTKNVNDSSAAASARSAATASSNAAATSDSNANNALHNDINVGGPEVATTVNTPNNIDQSYSNQIDFESSPVLTLVPQGHTAGCQRTIGFAWGDNNSGGGFGIPFRDKNCDYDNEAADAFAAGQMKIGWYWNCHKKSSYKPFRKSGMSVESARNACFEKMVSMLVVVSPPYHPSEPPVEVNVDACCKDRNKCGSDHPEIHKRIFEACQSK